MYRRTKNPPFNLLFLLIGMMLIPTLSFGEWEKPVVIDGPVRDMVLDGYISFIEDKNDTITFSDILTKKDVMNWKSCPNIRFGYSSSSYWFRVTIDNRKPHLDTYFMRLDYIDINYIEFYKPVDGIPEKPVITGSDFHANTREVRDRTFVFKVQPPKGVSYCYFKVKSITPISFSVHLLSDKSYIQRKNIELSLLFFLYSIVFIQIIYNLYLLFNFKEKPYALFIAYLLCLLLTLLRQTGHGPIYFWQDSYFLFKRCVFPFTYLSFALLIMFFVSFFETKKRAPVLHRFLILWNVRAAVVLAFFALIVDLPRFVRMLYILGIVYLNFLSFYVVFNFIKKEYKPAYFPAVGVGVSGIGIIIYILRVVGIIPSNNFTNWSVNIGLSAMAMMISFGLANKVNTMNRQAEKQKKILENLVAEKSAELKRKNRTLKEANDKNADILKQVSLLSGKISDGAHNVSGMVKEFSLRAKKQIYYLDKSLYSLEEIGKETDVNINRLAQAITLISQTNNSAQVGVKRMLEMVNAMEDISESGEGIYVILKTIDNIAFQTNLLALNASVEAARGGSYGKGFSVVAQEVRTLANRSTKAAKETTSLIENSGKRIEKGENTAISTSDALNRVNHTIDNIESLIFSISESGSRQAKDISRIKDNLISIKDDVAFALKGVEETLRFSDKFKVQSEKIENLMKSYQTSFRKPS